MSHLVIVHLSFQRLLSLSNHRKPAETRKLGHLEMLGPYFRKPIWTVQDGGPRKPTGTYVTSELCMDTIQYLMGITVDTKVSRIYVEGQMIKFD